MRNAFARTLYQVAKTDPKVFVVVADISPAAAMEPFVEAYPDQFVNVGLCEQTMVGVCAGLAHRGCTAFAYTIATFTIYRPFEQVRDDLCYQNLPVTLVGVGGGISYSLLGGTHHAQEDIAVMSALPNMSILAPCDPLETELATRACTFHDGPVYLRLGKSGESVLTANAAEPFEFGRLRLIKPGKDVCILSYGPIVKLAFDVAEQLESVESKSVAVASVHTVKPLDVERVSAILTNYETVVVIEEHSERGGLGARVKEIAWDCRASCKLHTYALRDAFVHVFGSQSELREAHGLSAERILKEVGSDPA